MAYRILITEEAKKDIDVLPKVVKGQLRKKLTYFKELPDIKVVAKKLVHHEIGEYRLRVGVYRILFDLDKHTIVILRVIHRKDVYR